jgi:hypothetical protein
MTPLPVAVSKEWRSVLPSKATFFRAVVDCLLPFSPQEGGRGVRFEAML